MFDTVLVANRGEIAVRITRTLRALGIRSVAVYSDADADARHVRDADVAVRIGPAPAADSYLRVDRVVEAALATGAQALHPGYGFLSENTALAAACAAAGIVFVGPPPEAIEAMGDKIRAKATVAANGVRVVPGVSGVGLDDDELAARAAEVGYPILVKPSAGGGGKGMHLVTEPARLGAELAAARREALGAFGDDTLLLERYIERPRHIEVQVLADAHGHVVHLGERECSLQRRHQKVVEEAPSPFLSGADRAAIGAQAVAAARACGYVNAGTVEFIVGGDRPDEPYFMEMNTRLQVEHPVTEAVWGVDLVALQLRVAAGEALPFAQDDLVARGHAFEARVYAEDPGHGFLPTGGTVLALDEPTAMADVRVDSSLLAGTEVGSVYDPMLAKVVAWGEDREAARRRLDAALAATTILGVTTNVAFLRTVLGHPDVVAGRLDTGLVERIAATIAPEPPGGTALADAALAAALAELVGPARHPDPWADTTGWRLGGPAWSTWRAETAGRTPVVVRHRGAPDGDGWEVDVAGGPGVERVRASPFDGGLGLERAGRRTAVRLARDGAAWWVGAGGQAVALTAAGPRAPGAAAGRSSGDVESPMPGTVAAVLVATGDAVVAGQALVVVEAMKMEHTLTAAVAGVVDVRVAVGDRVALAQVVAAVAPADEEG